MQQTQSPPQNKIRNKIHELLNFLNNSEDIGDRSNNGVIQVNQTQETIKEGKGNKYYQLKSRSQIKKTSLKENYEAMDSFLYEIEKELMELNQNKNKVCAIIQHCDSIDEKFSSAENQLGRQNEKLMMTYRQYRQKILGLKIRLKEEDDNFILNKQRWTELIDNKLKKSLKVPNNQNLRSFVLLQEKIKHLRTKLQQKDQQKIEDSYIYQERMVKQIQSHIQTEKYNKRVQKLENRLENDFKQHYQMLEKIVISVAQKMQ